MLRQGSMIDASSTTRDSYKNFLDVLLLHITFFTQLRNFSHVGINIKYRISQTVIIILKTKIF
jgi:hypothetical protein